MSAVAHKHDIESLARQHGLSGALVRKRLSRGDSLKRALRPPRRRVDDPGSECRFDEDAEARRFVRDHPGGALDDGGMEAIAEALGISRSQAYRAEASALMKLRTVLRPLVEQEGMTPREALAFVLDGEGDSHG